MLFAPFFRGLARHLRFACLALTATTAAVFAQTSAPTANDGFDPNIDGVVMAMVRQGDGKIIVAGQFANVQPNGGAKVSRNNIARFNPDGTLDTTFDPNANGAVRTIALQQNGQVIIGGDFTKVDGNPHSYVCRLNPNGSPDDSFTASIGKSLDASVALPTTPQVMAVALQADGSVVVGGTFGSASSSGIAAVQRNNLVRFTSTGALDPTYNPNPNGIVLALMPYLNNTLIVGGGFSSFQPTGQASVSRYHAAKLNADGSVDQTFDPSTDDGVTAIALQRDGKILLGGYFTVVQPNGAANGVQANHIVRLNSDGTRDDSFDPSIGGDVYTLAVSSDGAIYVGGHFSQIYTGASVLQNQAYIARLLQDGSADNNFTGAINFDVNAIAFQTDGKVVVGGAFTRAQSPGTNGVQVVRNHIARLLQSGALDTAFVIPGDGRVLKSVTLSDGSIIVGGSFTTLGGTTRTYIAKLNADGTVDPAFYPILDGSVYAMAYDSTHQQIVIGGSFTTVGGTNYSNGTTRNRIARLNVADGSLDTSFDPNLNGNVSSIVMLSDGSMLVGGTFTSAQPAGTTTAVSRFYILKLTSAGQVDANFNPSANAAVTSLAVQSDGKIIVGGSFTSFQPGATGNTTSRTYIARLNSDGTLDGSYNPNVVGGGQVNAIVLQSDGKAVIGGQFQAFAPPGAKTVTIRNFLARINTDGSIDSTFDPNANNWVLTLALSGDKIIAGGTFTALDPNEAATATPMLYVARLNADGTVDTSFNLNLNQQLGNRVDYLAVQPTGDLLVGGTFTSVQAGTSAPVARNHLARIKADGTLDATFDPHPSGVVNNAVNAISVQGDDKALVGGAFSDLGGAKGPNLARFNPEGTPDLNFNNALSTDGAVNAIAVRAGSTEKTTQLGGFAWLDPNGALRTSFAPTVTTQGRVSSSLVLPDGSVLIAGAFTGGDSIVKILPTGVVDSSFTTSVAGVLGMVLQPDQKIIIYGQFTSVNGVTQNYLARLNTDGTLDTTFAPTPGNYVYSAVVQSDGSVVFAGSFTTVQPVGSTSSTTRNYIARVDSTGKVDATFDPNLNGAAYTLALQSDGKIVVGGTFTTATPNGATIATTRNFILRVNTDGTVDSGFDPNANYIVNAVAIQPADQKIVVGGSFTTIGGTNRSYIARLNTDGTLDTSFSPVANSTISIVKIAPDNSILLGGSFTTVTGSGSSTPATRFHVARLTAEGLVDSNFNPALGGEITDIKVAPDSSVLVSGTFLTEFAKSVIVIGGSFNTVAGQSQPYLSELNEDGSVNTEFTSAPDQPVNAVVALPDGGFLVGGAFTKLGTITRNGLARFDRNSAIDPSFNPSLSGGVTAIAVQSDSKVLVGTGSGAGLVRLNADGSTDGSFTAGAPFMSATAIAVQPDGKIIVAGPGSGVATRVMRLNADGSVDSSFGPVTVNSGGTIQTLTLQTDGSIVVAGSFTTIAGQSIANLARLTAGGTVDTTFNPAPNGPVTAIGLESDGRLLLGGGFSAVGGVTRFSLARISNTGPAIQTLGVSADGQTVTLLRSGTAAEAAAVSFQSSTDGLNWTYLGAGTRIGAGNWQITGVSIPTSGNVYIRADAVVPTDAGKSTGIYETMLLVNLSAQVPSTSLAIAPVISTKVWDASHYVWTIDSNGILRIADAFSLVTYDSSKTVLLNGGTVGGKTAASAARLADLSTRGIVTADTPLISGFAITGSSSRQVLIRAAGPGLAPFGVANYLKVPQLILYNQAGTVLATNKGWDSALLTQFAQVGAFPFTPGSTDAAFVVTLAPGTYTVQVTDAGSGAGGDTLIEIYDAGSLTDGSARLMNLSTRGTVNAGSTLIGGLVVSGNAPKTMLVRGIGPALSRFGVSNTLADPVIAVYDANGDVVATNDNWGTSSVATMSSSDYAAGVSSAAQSAGAFSLDLNSTDAALVITLPAGAYTVQLRSANGAAGNGMIEVYELP